MCRTQINQEVQDKILIIKSLSITSYIHIVIHNVVHESLILENSAGEVGWPKASHSRGANGGDAGGVVGRDGRFQGFSRLQLGTERSPYSSAVSRILQMTGDSTLNTREQNIKDYEIINKLLQETATEMGGLMTTECEAQYSSITL